MDKKKIMNIVDWIPATFCIIVSFSILITLIVLFIADIVQSASYPVEAYKACEGRKTGEMGQITNKMGTVLQGICEEQDGKLVIVKPNWYPKKVYPPEAYKACAHKKAGAASQYTNSRKITVKGKCVKEDGKLVLVSAQEAAKAPRTASKVKPLPPAQPTDTFSACSGKKDGDESLFVNPFGKTIKGKCEEQGGKIFLRPYREQN